MAMNGNKSSWTRELDIFSKIKSLIILEGDIPSPANPPKGCKFHTRCKYCTQRCKEEAPRSIDVGGGHTVCCHLHDK